MVCHTTVCCWAICSLPHAQWHAAVLYRASPGSKSFASLTGYALLLVTRLPALHNTCLHMRAWHGTRLCPGEPGWVAA